METTGVGHIESWWGWSCSNSRRFLFSLYIAFVQEIIMLCVGRWWNEKSACIFCRVFIPQTKNTKVFRSTRLFLLYSSCALDKPSTTRLFRISYRVEKRMDSRGLNGDFIICSIICRILHLQANILEYSILSVQGVSSIHFYARYTHLGDTVGTWFTTSCLRS